MLNAGFLRASDESTNRNWYESFFKDPSTKDVKPAFVVQLRNFERDALINVEGDELANKLVDCRHLSPEPQIVKISRKIQFWQDKMVPIDHPSRFYAIAVRANIEYPNDGDFVKIGKPYLKKFKCEL